MKKLSRSEAARKVWVDYPDKMRQAAKKAAETRRQKKKLQKWVCRKCNFVVLSRDKPKPRKFESENHTCKFVKAG